MLGSTCVLPVFYYFLSVGQPILYKKIRFERCINRLAGVKPPFVES